MRSVHVAPIRAGKNLSAKEIMGLTSAAGDREKEEQEQEEREVGQITRGDRKHAEEAEERCQTEWPAAGREPNRSQERRYTCCAVTAMEVVREAQLVGSQEDENTEQGQTNQQNRQQNSCGDKSVRAHQVTDL